jgi:hypothetical protein
MVLIELCSRERPAPGKYIAAFRGNMVLSPALGCATSMAYWLRSPGVREKEKMDSECEQPAVSTLGGPDSRIHIKLRRTRPFLLILRNGGPLLN